jgi:lipocalin-like protein
MGLKEDHGLIGTWRLVTYEGRDSVGQPQYPIGQNVTGQLIYDANGNMSAHIMRSDRPTFAANDIRQGTDTEVRAAFEGHTSYFGTYTLNPTIQTVTHHVQGCSYPNWIGNDLVRYYKFDDGRLVLSTPSLVSRGESLEFVMTWERADAGPYRRSG